MDDADEDEIESNDSNHLEESEKKDDSGIEIDVDCGCTQEKAQSDVSMSVKRNNVENLVQPSKRRKVSIFHLNT